jgi:hypothetical protein
VCVSHTVIMPQLIGGGSSSWRVPSGVLHRFYVVRGGWYVAPKARKIASCHRVRFVVIETVFGLRRVVGMALRCPMREAEPLAHLRRHGGEASHRHFDVGVSQSP